MTRRSASLTLAGILLVATLALAMLEPVPFVTMSPGPTENTLGEIGGHQIIQISGHKTYPTRGALDLTTVSVTPPGVNIRLPEAIRAWFDPDRALLPSDVVYPPKESVERVQQQNVQQMRGSQQTAVAAALTELGIPVARRVVVTRVKADAPASGKLRAGDVLLRVNDEVVKKLEDVSHAMGGLSPGDQATFVVERDGNRVTVDMSTEADPDDPAHAVVGIVISSPTYDLPFKVKVDIGSDIGGPSAGTIFALAIYDKLTPGSLTGGATVAGTGEISDDGTVAAIGGIAQKIVGAENSGASVFLVPAPNCSEALDANVETSSIQLVKVSTLHGAVTSLEALAADPQAAVPHC
jgi:PDZ domain-containing protein